MRIIEEIWRGVKKQWFQIKLAIKEKYSQWAQEVSLSYTQALNELELMIRQKPPRNYETVVPNHWKLKMDYV